MFSLDIAGIAISALFILFILFKGKLRKTDLLLACINLAIIALLVVDAMFHTKLNKYNFLLLNIIPVQLFPLFFIYAIEILQEKIHHHGRWILLFIPALITSGFIVSDLFVFHHYNQAQLEHLYNSPTLWYHLLCKGFPIVFLFGFAWILKRLNKYNSNIKDSYSYIDPIDLNWLKSSTWIYIIITVLSLIGFLTSQLQILPITSHTVCSVIGILMFFAVFFVSFHGIQQYSVADFYSEKKNSIVDHANNLPEQESKEEQVPIKYKTSVLSLAEQIIIYQNLVKLFEDQKIYQEPKLQLSDVADALNITTHNLSQTINATTGKPFYDFVNSYRIKHLQKLLEDPAQQKFTILALGFESGFNSKASLNRVFRQETGLTPSEYLKRIQYPLVSS